ncbi:Na+/H+ antiporter subunit E [Bacillus sp. EB106-08-02-XG196]|uniref:Na+/H+ antiporter subunit E n=1 Tax=Bacillus sp. EB106-08-02-XG196 TaxID=2737049 RepID=UPI0015C4435B|nr:Na+/H+ antiporter subunit E [Bacillus sp. EB106-08-02-XG196]NWQ42060.1 Na+/H+ antiporter subunit E [Bacillus sp. EB106-08-02-XG196]
MAFQILLNVVLAFLWMFIKVSYDPISFIKGYIFGLVIIFVLRRSFGSRFYLFRLWSFIKLIFIFIKELILSNIAIVKVVLKPKLDMRPAIFAMDTELTRDWQITLLSSLITLTPGTLVIDVSEDNRTLFIHAMNIGEVEDEINSIKNSFEKAILEVSS